jgi:hypothetical protein
MPTFPASALCRATRGEGGKARVLGDLPARQDLDTLLEPADDLVGGGQVVQRVPRPHEEGGGIGAALVKSDFRTDWDPTLSVAVGTGVRVTERLGVTGEFRLRGHEWDFVGTTAEISAGLAWRFPSF